MTRRLALVAALALVAMLAAPAHAWDSATHRLITRLAIAALPDSPLRSSFQIHEMILEEHSVEPDSLLKARYGKAEERRHYIDLEHYGRHPFDQLVPDRAQMIKRVGIARFDRAGTLPWTIEETASQSEEAWRSSDCSAVYRYSGYLAHYVGDATQPLHATEHFDGYAGDKGIHARIEAAVDSRVREIGEQAAPQVRVVPIGSPWAVAIDELQGAYNLVNDIIADDRAARAQSGGGAESYDSALFARANDLFVHQIAVAASSLGSLWLYEWRQAGSPAVCSPRHD